MKGLGRGGRARKLFAQNPAKYGFTKGYPNTKRQQLLKSGDEVKNLDTTLLFVLTTTGVCSTTAATGNIHIVPQGDTAVTREGRKITITSISIQGNLTLTPGNGATAAEMSYIYMILDKQCNGANPGITDVFTSNDLEKNQLNLNNSKRFKVLKKWVVRLQSQAGDAATGYNESMRHLKWYHKCEYPIYYNNTTGAITETTQNSIFFAFGSTAGRPVNFDGTCRIRFVG